MAQVLFNSYHTTLIETSEQIRNTNTELSHAPALFLLLMIAKEGQ